MIVIDNETSGISVKKHGLLETGALFLLEEKDKFVIVDKFYEFCRLRDDAEISKPGDVYAGNPGAFAINGYTEKEARDPGRQPLERLIINFINWSERTASIAGPTSNITLAGQNIRFDMSFLEDAAKRAKIKWIFGSRGYDSFSAAIAEHLKRGIPLPLHGKRILLNGDSVFEHSGIPKEPLPHKGLQGAKFVAEALSRLNYGKNLLSEFSEYPVPAYLKRYI